MTADPFDFSELKKQVQSFKSTFDDMKPACDWAQLISINSCNSISEIVTTGLVTKAIFKGISLKEKRFSTKDLDITEFLSDLEAKIPLIYSIDMLCNKRCIYHYVDSNSYVYVNISNTTFRQVSVELMTLDNNIFDYVSKLVEYHEGGYKKDGDE